jgi:Fic family protein
VIAATPQRIEPALIEGQIPEEVADLVAELAARAATLGAALHPRTAASLADLVRIMNAYYSNLIEGHNTRPADIERALAGQIDGNEERRNLQFEAASHVRVQRYVDALAVEAALPEPASIGFIEELHRRFYLDAPTSVLQIKNGDHVYEMLPGVFRSERAHDVVAGRHRPPSSEGVADAMAYFAERYRFEGKSKTACVLAAASAHHRFNYIHPFPDGNGRVSRLMSHAMLQYAGVGSHGLWSVSRGLARGIEDRGEYKQMMDIADTPRENDFDGRGNLSLHALVRFVAWFLRVCVDQVDFMSSFFELNRLSERLYRYGMQDDSLGEAGARLLEEAAIRGEFERGAVERVTGLPSRSARRVLKELLDRGVLASDTPRGAVSLRFRLPVAEQLFPRLFMPPTSGSNEAPGFS